MGASLVHGQMLEGLWQLPYVCAACRHVVWNVLVDGGWIGHGPSIPERLFRCCVGY